MSFFKEIFFKKQSFGAPEGYNVSLSPCRDQGGRWIAMGNKPEREEGQGVGRELAVWGWGRGGEGRGEGAECPFCVLYQLSIARQLCIKTSLGALDGVGGRWGEKGEEIRWLTFYLNFFSFFSFFFFSDEGYEKMHFNHVLWTYSYTPIYVCISP